VSEENNNTDSDESICTSDIEGDDINNTITGSATIYENEDDSWKRLYDIIREDKTRLPERNCCYF
jgi:hypothetical protein